VSRSRHPEDGRKVLVRLEEAGERKIEEVFPVFNTNEARFTARLDIGEKHELARLLRLVTATADGVELIHMGGDDPSDTSDRNYL
jgi:DNA-binding MarR family transcriptional regulator